MPPRAGEPWAAFLVMRELAASRLLGRSIQPLDALNCRHGVHGQGTALLDLGRREPRRRETRPGLEAAIVPGIFGRDRRGENAALNHSADVVERVDRGYGRLTAFSGATICRFR